MQFNIINNGLHVARYFPRTYSSCNWKWYPLAMYSRTCKNFFIKVYIEQTLFILNSDSDNSIGPCCLTVFRQHEVDFEYVTSAEVRFSRTFRLQQAS